MLYSFIIYNNLVINYVIYSILLYSLTIGFDKKIKILLKNSQINVKCMKLNFFPYLFCLNNSNNNLNCPF